MVPKRKIRAFCGKAGSGKSYSTSRLIETMNFEKISFADPLRDIAFQVIGVPFDKGMQHYRKLKETKHILLKSYKIFFFSLGVTNSISFNKISVLSSI